MSAVQRIGKNTAVLSAAYIVTSLLNFLLFISIARTLGDVTLGEYSFAVAITSVAGVFLNLGYNTLLTREVSRNKSLITKYLGNIVVVKAILSVIVFGLIALVVNLMPYRASTTAVVLIFSVYTVFTAFSDIFKATFRAFERMEFEALAQVLGGLVTVSLGLAAVFWGYGVIAVAYAFLIGSLVDLLFSYFICRHKFARVKLNSDAEFLRKVTRAAIPMGFFAVSQIIFVRIDSVMLSAMKGNAVVGWYNAAYNPILALKPIPVILATAVLPVMARFFIFSTESLRATYEKSLRYLFILGLPMSVGIMLLARRIILLLYGADYTHSIVALQILAWDVLLFFLYALLATLLISIDRQKQMAVAGGICAVVNVILNLILIPNFSYIGSSIATIVCELVLFGLYLYFVSQYLIRLPLHKTAFKPIIACAVMALFVCFSPRLNLAAIIILAAAIYFATLVLIRGLSGQDIALLNQLVRIPGTIGRWFGYDKGRA